jgi:hypothetical protein
MLQLRAADELRVTKFRAARFVVVGGICGFAWATGLRGFMAEVAGAESNVDWRGTFVWVLAPGVLIGLLLGLAEHVRTTGGRRGWRWLALSPLLFGALLLSNPFDLAAILEDGIGGGAIGVPLFGMAGGFALSGRGPGWARVLCGIFAAIPIPIWGLTVTSIAGPNLAVDTARGAWVALYFWSFLGVLMLACSIPHRPVTPAALRG